MVENTHFIVVVKIGGLSMITISFLYARTGLLIDMRESCEPRILRFYDPTYPKRFESFKDLYNCLESVR